MKTLKEAADGIKGGELWGTDVKSCGGGLTLREIAGQVRVP